MGDTITPIRVFISSPGDLVVERAVVRAVLDQLNRSSAFRDRYKFIAYAWEQDVPALMGRAAQDVVESFLLDPADADMLVCMFWQRMGSPQERLDPQTQQPYQSGTEYEFLRAYRAYQERGRPLILLYRCLRPSSSDAAVDQDQAERVERFFARFRPGGELKGLIGTFRDTTDFEATLARDITLLLERELASSASPLQSLGPPIASSTDASADRVPHGPRHNLPLELTSFIGRSRELVLVGQRFESARLVTLTGVGGIGKTRLALRAAHELLTHFPGGVWLVELAPLTDEALIVATIATVLGVREEADRPLLATLTTYLRDKQLLLFLDNCEHLIDGCARLADELLHGAPELRILATSREPLGVAGEALVSVPGLVVPQMQQRPVLEAVAQVEAVHLFVERARAVEPGFELTPASAAPLMEVCRRLDGIALAIELAAARVRMLTIEQIARHLEDNFRLLRSGSRTTLPRHQTLQASIEWSYNLLSEAERVLLRRLAVFAGGWTLEAAEALAGGAAEDEALEVLRHLVDKSLVQVEVGSAAARYRMLEPIRHYTLERLAECGEADAVRQQHAMYFLELAEQAEPWIRFMRPERMQWLERLETEHANLRAGLEWYCERGEIEHGLRLAGALRVFWVLCFHWSEGRTWLEAVLAKSEKMAAPARAKALAAAGHLFYFMGDLTTARAYTEEELALVRGLGDKVGLASALCLLADIMKSTGDLITARAYAEESLAVFDEVSDQWGRPYPLHILVGIAQEQGDVAQATIFNEELLTSGLQIGDKRGIATGLTNMGIIAQLQGDWEHAVAVYAESLTFFREVGDKEATAMALHNLGGAILHQGNEQWAAACFAEGLALSRDIGSRPRIANNLAGMAGVAALQERAERSARLLGAADALFEAMGMTVELVDRIEYDRNRESARAQLGDAAFAAAWEAGRTLTMEQAIALALEVAAEVPPPTPTPPAAPQPAIATAEYPAGLTAREVAVLRLIAQGLTYAQVAERLVISTHTVHTHLRAIYGKLKVTSRAAATRFAIEHQLT